MKLCGSFLQIALKTASTLAYPKRGILIYYAGNLANSVSFPLKYIYISIHWLHSTAQHTFSRSICISTSIKCTYGINDVFVVLKTYTTFVFCFQFECIEVVSVGPVFLYSVFIAPHHTSFYHIHFFSHHILFHTKCL